MPEFFLKCLGYPELRLPNGKVIRFRVKKHFALLIYLAVERRKAHDRGRLVELLWPRAPGRLGRHSCATALSYVRKVVGGDSVTATRSIVRFTASQLRLDLDLLDRGELFDENGQPTIDIDGFLGAFDIDDSPEFGHWKETERARRRPTIYSGLLRLLDNGRRRGSNEEILHWSERLRNLDPLSEEGIRAQMEALTLAGDRVAALRVFEQWKAHLSDDLRAAPSTIVEDMAAQLRRSDWNAKGLGVAPAVAAEQWRDRPFIGRRKEFTRLYDTWESANHYRPKHILVAGDSGIGKTTLTQRLVTTASLEGAHVVRVQCYPSEGRIPFATIGGIVMGLLARPGAAATAPEALSEIARIVPHVRTHFPHLPATTQRDTESARLLFAEGVLDLVRALLNEHPLLLVVDDIHYADDATLSVLHFVVRRIDDGRLTVAMAASTDADPTAFAKTLDWTASIGADRLDVDRMSGEEIAGLLRSLLDNVDPSPTTTELRAIARAAKGNPMVLELLAQDWHSNKRDCLALSVRAFTTRLSDTPQPDRRIDRIVNRLLNELDQSGRQALYLATILDQRLNDLTMYSLIDLTIGQALEAFAELTTKRVFREVSGKLEFINELVRASVYRSIPAAFRTRLHSAIADRIRTQPSEPEPGVDLETAWHLIRSQRVTEAVPHVLDGARSALTNGAPDSAVLALESSSYLFDPATAREGAALLVEALIETSRWADALRVASAYECDDEDGEFRILAAEARWRMNLLDPLDKAATARMLANLGHEKRAWSWARACSVAAFMSGDLKDESVMAYVWEKLPDPDVTSGRARAQLLIAKAAIAFHRRQIATGEESAIAARAALLEAGASDSMRARIELGIGAFRCARGDYATGAIWIEEAVSLGKRLDNDAVVSVGSANLAIAELRLGHLESAVQLARSLPRTSDPVSRANASYAELCALALLGRTAEATSRLQSLRQTFSSERWLIQKVHFDRADAYWLLEQRSKALQEARFGCSMSTNGPLARGTTGSYARWRSRVASRGSVPEELQALLSGLFSERTSLDAIDQYELLLEAERQDLVAPNVSREALHIEIQDLRNQLPAATVSFLRQLSE